MKKLFKNAIFTCLFALCCVFTIFSINLLSVEVNATKNEILDDEEQNNEEKEEEHKHTEVVVDGYAPTCTEDGLDVGVICGECGEVLFEQAVIPALGHSYSEFEIIKDATETEKGIKKQICNLCNFENLIEFDLEKTEENPPLEDLPQIDDEQIEETFNQIKDWIIALVVSFLGSSGFMALVKVVIDKWSKKKQEELDLRLSKLEEEKKIAEEQKEQISNQFKELTNQFNEVLECNTLLIDYIKTKIEVDELKVNQTNKLLESLLPVLPNENENEGDINEK